MPVGNIENNVELERNPPPDENRNIANDDVRIKRYAVDAEGNEFEARPIDEAELIRCAYVDIAIIKDQQTTILEANETAEIHTASLENKLERLQARQNPNAQVQQAIQDITNFLA